ncbi:MAG TPA: hypothetical protein VFN03_09830, partial [Trueperaceae bacterium]|nr:hypothetical protein [Trueperaceae bacterium]
MSKPHPARAFGALILGLAVLLAACSQPSGPQDASVVTFSLSLTDAAATAETIQAQGAPFDPSTGATAIETVHVTVRDSNNAPVAFSFAAGTYTVDPAGVIPYVTLEKSAAIGGITSATVALPAAGNPYTFESLGYASVTDPVIAYADQSVNVVDGGTVWISPVAVLGAASLATRYPTTYVIPGSVLDVMLVVAANGHDDIAGGAFLQVPLGDFVASYDAPSGASILSQSNRGLRLQIDAQCTGPLTLSGNAAGLVEVASDFVPGTVSMSGSGLVLPCSPVNDGTVSIDTEPPTVSISSLDGNTGLVVGQADDNFGIAKVQVFDGPVLLASTDENEAVGGVSLIAFVHGTTEFRTYLTTTPQGGVTAVAFDAS